MSDKSSNLTYVKCLSFSVQDNQNIRDSILMTFAFIYIVHTLSINVYGRFLFKMKPLFTEQINLVFKGVILLFQAIKMLSLIGINLLNKSWQHYN